MQLYRVKGRCDKHNFGLLLVPENASKGDCRISCSCFYSRKVYYNMVHLYILIWIYINLRKNMPFMDILLPPTLNSI
jgi:hypothetical protein